MSVVAKTRIQALLQLRKSIFRETYNPENIRTGAKVLRQPLKGDLLKDYYIQRNTLPNARQLNKLFPELNCIDPLEDRRLAKVANQRRKGKAPPKKLDGPRDKKKR